MTTTLVSSFGRRDHLPHEVVRPAFLDGATAIVAAAPPPLLARGLGRASGDVGLNRGGWLVATDRLDRFQAFDAVRGVVRAEAGVSLDRLLRLIVPHGWFLPVAPGSKFVTLGGAVASDVYGRDHPTAGTLGRHVRRIGLARSSGETLTLSRDDNAALFAATVGGLGLTGLIVWVELDLVATPSAQLDAETVAFGDLDGFFRLAEESTAATADRPFRAARVDGRATGRALGRGVFVRAGWAAAGDRTLHRPPRLAVPFDVPEIWIAPLAVRAFDALCRRRSSSRGRRRTPYDPFFFPRDAVAGWNRLYGPYGFYQHRSVVPLAVARETVRKMLEAAAGQGPFLAGLGLTGDIDSPGVLSFPRAGVTLALEVQNRGEPTRALLLRLAEIVMTVGGRLDPATDAVMTGDMFRAGYPDWRKVEAARDPAFCCDFWRRVVGGAA